MDDTPLFIPIETPSKGTGGCSRMTASSGATAGLDVLLPAHPGLAIAGHCFLKLLTMLTIEKHHHHHHHHHRRARPLGAAASVSKHSFMIVPCRTLVVQNNYSWCSPRGLRTTRFRPLNDSVTFCRRKAQELAGGGEKRREEE